MGAQIILELASESSSTLAPVTCPHHFHKHLFSDITKCSKLILCLPAPQPWRQPWLLLVGNGVREDDLSTRCVYCYGYLGLVALTADRSKTICVYRHINIYMHTHICTHKIINMQIHTHIYILKIVVSNTTNTSTEFIFCPLPHFYVSHFTGSQQYYTFSHLLNLLIQSKSFRTNSFLLLLNNQVH